MSKAAISGLGWAEMSEAQRIDFVRAGRASLKEMVEGLLDGPDGLREACRKFLMRSDVCLQQPAPEPDPQTEEPAEATIDESTAALLEGARKRRPGLPEGYVPRPYRH